MSLDLVRHTTQNSGMKLLVENLNKEYRGRAQAVRALHQKSSAPARLACRVPMVRGKSTLMRIFATIT